MSSLEEHVSNGPCEMFAKLELQVFGCESYDTEKKSRQQARYNFRRLLFIERQLLVADSGDI